MTGGMDRDGRAQNRIRRHRLKYLVDMLVSEGPMYGLQLVERSDGALKRGTVYVTLGTPTADVSLRVRPHTLRYTNQTVREAV
jgi:hypothetical protein